MSDALENLKRELAQADLFFEWDDLLLELVASICEERTYMRGELVFNENSLSDELYIITEGEIEIQVHPGLLGTGKLGQEIPSKTIAVLRRGQNFGEVALLDEGRRSAAAVCRENGTRLIVIKRDKLILMCENVPKLGYVLMRSLALDLAMKIRSTDLDIRAHLMFVPQRRDG